MEMELELGLAPPVNARRRLDGDDTVSAAAACWKRRFGESFAEEQEEEKTAATTLPLFDDGSSSDCRRKKKKKPVVGWPPVSSARRAGGGNHVKVKKEGVAIGRKVDLSLHTSYDELLATLARMFLGGATAATAAQDHKDGDRDHGCRAAAAADVDDDGRVVVTYEDADGDWMLVGDVPWDDFTRSAKRLNILQRRLEKS